MHWLQLGVGTLSTVIVPAASDGLWTAGQSLVSSVWLAWRYRRRLKTHRLMVLSRREPIPFSFDVQRHADDYLQAVEQLHWGPAVWECVSAGGPIGQWTALRRPDLVQGLILASTTHRVDKRLHMMLTTWCRLACERRWAELYSNMLYLNQGPKTIHRDRRLRPFMRMLPTPWSPQRFVRLVSGLLTLDNRAMLPNIGCPTLVVGGRDDRLIAAGLQQEMARLIPHSRLVLYEGYGHAAPLEHPEYEHLTRRFSEWIQCS